MKLRMLHLLVLILLISKTRFAGGNNGLVTGNNGWDGEACPQGSGPYECCEGLCELEYDLPCWRFLELYEFVSDANCAALVESEDGLKCTLISAENVLEYRLIATCIHLGPDYSTYKVLTHSDDPLPCPESSGIEFNCGDGVCNPQAETCFSCPDDCGECDAFPFECDQGINKTGLFNRHGRSLFFNVSLEQGDIVECQVILGTCRSDVDLFFRYDGSAVDDCQSINLSDYKAPHPGGNNNESCISSPATQDGNLIVELRPRVNFTNVQLVCSCYHESTFADPSPSVDPTPALVGGDIPQTIPAKPRLIRTLEHETESVRNLAWNPDGTILASSTNDTVYVWSTETFDLIGSWNDRDPAADDIVDLTWSPDGKFLAVVENGGAPVKIYSTINWKIVQTIEHSVTTISSLEFSPNNVYLALSDLMNASQSLQLISTDTWAVEKTFAGDSVLFDVSWSPDGSLLALGGRQAITYLNISTWELSEMFSDEAYVQYEDLSWAPDGSAIAAVVLSTSVPETNVILVETVDQVLLGQIQTLQQGNAIRTVDWSPTFIHIASGMSSLQDGGRCTVFYGAAFNAIEVFKTGVETKKVAFNPDGSILAIASGDGTVSLWTISDPATPSGEEPSSNNNNTVVQCKDESECARQCESTLIAIQECLGNTTSQDSGALAICAACFMDNHTESSFAFGEISVEEYVSTICDNASKCKDVCGMCFSESEKYAQCFCPSYSSTISPTTLPREQPSMDNQSTAPSLPPSQASIRSPSSKPTTLQTSPPQEPTSPTNIFEKPSAPFQDTLIVTLWGMRSIMTDYQKEIFARGTQNFLHFQDETVGVDVISQILLHSSRNRQGKRQLQQPSGGLQLTTLFSSWQDDTPGTTASQTIAGPNVPGYIQQLQFQDGSAFGSVSDVDIEFYYAKEQTQAPTSAIGDYGSWPEKTSSSSGMSGAILFVIVFLVILAVIITWVCIRVRRRVFRQTESSDQVDKAYDNFYATYAGQDQHHENDGRRDAFFDDGDAPDDSPFGTSRANGQNANKTSTRHSDAVGSGTKNHLDNSDSDNSDSFGKDCQFENRVSPERQLQRESSLADAGMSLFGEYGFGHQSSTSTTDFAIDGPRSGSAWG